MKNLHSLVSLAFTASLATANQYETSIGTNKACYSRGEPIYVHFVNQDCRSDDWVGIYPAGTNINSLPEESLKMWVWTCGRQRRQCNVEHASIKFASERQEAYDDTWPLEQGQYVVFLARNSDSPYSGIAMSSIFSVHESCDPGNGNDDDNVNTDEPSKAATQPPTYNPTPITPAPTTSAPTSPNPTTERVTSEPTILASIPTTSPSPAPTLLITPNPTTSNPTTSNPTTSRPITPVPETAEPTMLTSNPTEVPSSAPTLPPMFAVTLSPSNQPSTSTNTQCPEVPINGCSICGEGKCVGNPSAIFAFPNEPPVDCGTLQQVGLDGIIPLDQCAFLPSFIQICDCREEQQLPEPSNQPSVNLGGCSVCGDGKSVGNPDAVFAFPDQPRVPCGTLELAGADGRIPASACDVLPNLISVCECEQND